MGVSIDGGPSIDLAAIVAGGPELLARMQAFNDAKATATAALATFDAAKASADEYVIVAERTADKLVADAQADRAAAAKELADAQTLKAQYAALVARAQAALDFAATA